MPFRSRRKPYRRYRKKKKNYPVTLKRNTKIAKGIPFFNIPKVSKLKYTETVPVTSAGGVLGTHVFRMQSIFDPNLTGAGHQPYGHDTMETLFHHYVVLGAKVTVLFTPDTTGGVPSAYGLLIGPDNTMPYSTFENVKEARQGVQYQSRGGALGTRTLVLNYSTKKFFNVSNINDNIGRLGASFGTNPNEEAFLHVYQQSIDFATTTTVYCTVTIDYVCQFSEPRLLSVS